MAARRVAAFECDRDSVTRNHVISAERMAPSRMSESPMRCRQARASCAPGRQVVLYHCPGSMRDMSRQIGRIDRSGEIEHRRLAISRGCSKGHATPAIILTEEADLLATRLRTPLQIQQHLALALEAAYQAGEKPVSCENVASVLSREIDDLEPTLTRHGYRIKDLVEQFDAKPAEIKALFQQLARCPTCESVARQGAALGAASMRTGKRPYPPDR